MKKIIYLVMALAVFAGLLAACGSGGASGSAKGGDKSVTIGSKNFTEQSLLSKITALYLKNNGFKVKESTGMGSNVLRKAVLNNQVDFAWEYTGTALVTYLKQKPISDPQKAFEKVKKLDKKQNNIDWINMSGVNNTYALLMQKKEADKLGIKSISDLAKYMNAHPGKLTFASDAEFASRSDGLKGVEKTYGFQFKPANVKKMKPGLTYKVLKKGQVDVAMGFSTDPRIKAYNLVWLKDDKGFFPAYYAAVEIRADVLKKYPKLKDLTANIAKKLDSNTMRQLNYQVDIGGKQVKDVAESWLKKNGMLK